MCLFRGYGNTRVALHQKAHALATGKRRLHAVGGADRPIPARPHQAAEVPDAGPADLLIRDARLLDDPHKTVTIAIQDGVITFVGDDAEAKALVSGATDEIDAGGSSVLPGLCDAHVHLLIGAERLRGCDVEDVRSADELTKRLKEYAKDHPDADVVYVYGLHYLDPPLIPAKTARQFLDAIDDTRPVFVYAHDLHTAWVNTRALEMADLMKKVPPYPPILKVLDLCDNLVVGDDGLPGGEMREPPVYFLVESVLHHRFPLSVEEKLENLEKTCRSLAQYGITRVHNMGLGSPEEDIETLMLLLELEQNGRLPIRIYSSYSVLPDEHMLTDISEAADAAHAIEGGRAQGHTYGQVHELLLDQLEQVAQKRDDSLNEMTKTKPGLSTHAHRDVLADHSGKVRSVVHATHVAPHQKRRKQRVAAGNKDTLPPTGMIDIQTVKCFMDGVIEKHTAFRMDEKPTGGIPAFHQDEIDQVVATADRLGMQVSAHCIGDGSVHALLDAIEGARRDNADADKERGRKVRHRIEHIELCDPADVPRFHALDVVPSMQPFHERDPWTLWHHTVPKERWNRAFLWRTLLETGVPLVFGSDWPIVSCDCLEASQHAADRKPWTEELKDQSVSVDQALRAFSTSTAVVEHMEDRLGRIAPGKLADMVILSGSLAEAPPGELKAAVTICAGEITYRR